MGDKTLNRQNRIKIAENTLQIIRDGQYISSSDIVQDIRHDLQHAIQNTCLYTPQMLEELLNNVPCQNNVSTQIHVRNQTTFAATCHLVVDQQCTNVACLNFASAKNPGGGFLGGSQAQEESLSRASALYETLLQAPSYYKTNRACGTCLYTDHMILSPEVPVFRNDDDELLEESYNVSIITAPAVNAGAVMKNEPQRVSEIQQVMARRTAMLLALAASQNYRHLVLGAWGCGVFRSDPVMIAKLFAEQLTGNGHFANVFESIVFAVLDRKDGKIIQAFEDQLTPHQSSIHETETT